jgi:radical SAM superfamily enzyme YgiQ (UPF0313 family)
VGGSVLFVNPNRIRPPIAPIAVDLLGAAAEDAGLGVEVCDLQWSRSPGKDLARALAARPSLVAVTIRNVNDSSMITRGCLLDDHAEIVRLIRARTDAPVVVGGAGFSIAPAATLRELGADFGVWGEGERSLVELALSLEKGMPPDGVPGVIRARGGPRWTGPPRAIDLSSAPTPRRTFVDNARYLAEGAQVGFETSRGCDRACAYCADPLLKGHAVRRRDPDSVAD